VISRVVFIFILLVTVKSGAGQTLGGQSAFSFLNLPSSPQLSALGGVNVSQMTNDVGLAFYNPSLLRPSMHVRLHAAFNDMYGGINAYQLSLGYHHEKIKTSFLWGIHYLGYGAVHETDAAGNLLGTLRPTDWVMHLAASARYRSRWNLGTTLKYIQSNYGQYRSNGIAVDVGLNYSDSSSLLSVSLLARNMGFQLKKYTGTMAADLPFDLQAGITKRLAHAPFSFSFTVHHLHQFDIRYRDTAFNNENGFDNGSSGKFSFDKLFRHFVFATTVYLGDKVEVQAGYNHLRRRELNVGEAGNGLNGFSLGAALLIKPLTVRYARSHYQNNTGYNQFGIGYSFKD